MKTSFRGKRIAGILTVLPEKEVYFEEEVGNYTFPEKQTMRLKKIMGYEKHRISKPDTSTSDLCVFGLNSLLDRNLIRREEIGAVVAVTLTPDHFVPHVSNIVQGRCNLPHDVLCMDIMQGCSGFEIGLMQSFLLLEHMDKKVVLMNADVLSHKVSIQDRNSYPLIGDAAAITVLENDSGAGDVFFNMYMDGSRGDALIMPAGGSRMPCSAKTAILNDDGEGNLRSLDNMCMNGSEVFQFVQTDVPPMIEETLAYAGLSKDQIDWYLFHQPNRFMLRKLAEKLGVPYEKMPMNIVENYGNASGATVPMVITHNLSAQMLKEKTSCCLSAFGSGLSWCAMTMELGEMDFCEMLVSSL